jgi:hypothetical protein
MPRRSLALGPSRASLAANRRPIPLYERLMTVTSGEVSREPARMLEPSRGRRTQTDVTAVSDRTKGCRMSSLRFLVAAMTFAGCANVFWTSGGSRRDSIGAGRSGVQRCCQFDQTRIPARVRELGQGGPPVARRAGRGHRVSALPRGARPGLPTPQLSATRQVALAVELWSLGRSPKRTVQMPRPFPGACASTTLGPRPYRLLGRHRPRPFAGDAVRYRSLDP